MLLWQLFKTFFIIGLVSFGGGYAIIPVIQTEVLRHEWMTPQQFTDMIAIAGMSPGPIATNSAVLVGYSMANLQGAVVSALGILLPSVILVLIIALAFQKLHHHPIVKSVFYGLRPIVGSLIVYSAIKFAVSNGLVSLDASFHTISLIVICGLSLFALLKLRWNPVYVIILSGLVGIALYS
ncbi:chromate transporter [Priestia filamentosa]|uniref:chromate transporter n=1 Tax=Priestia filamentosa TaxID=1402861 RepID=UPI00397D8781